MLKVKGDHGGCHNSHPLENSRRVGQNRLVWYRQDRAGPSHPPASFASMGTGSRVSCPHFSHTRLMIRAEAVMRTSAEKSLELRRRTRPSAESLHAIPPSPSSLIPLVARNKSRCWGRPNHDQVVPAFVLKTTAGGCRRCATAFPATAALLTPSPAARLLTQL
jgi:hypothetical protein